MEPEDSLPCSHKPATRPYPESAESIDPYLPKVHLNVILPPTPRSSHFISPKNNNISDITVVPALHSKHNSSGVYITSVFLEGRIVLNNLCQFHHQTRSDILLVPLSLARKC
jgi:hypothetical protein